MNAIAESSIEFMAAFEACPIAHFLLIGCNDAELRKMYRNALIMRVEAACCHLESIPVDLQESKHLERLSTLAYHCTAADVDLAREADHLTAAMILLDQIITERGDR